MRLKYLFTISIKINIINAMTKFLNSKGSKINLVATVHRLPFESLSVIEEGSKGIIKFMDAKNIAVKSSKNPILLK